MNSEFSLSADLLKATEALGYIKATPVQEKVIPLALLKKDVMARAETGSGKTAAYLLPTLQNLLITETTNKYTKVLVMVPTRELAKQVADECRKLATYTDLDVKELIGGSDFKADQRALTTHPEIIVATPGRLAKLIENGALKLAKIEHLIFDEADRMLDMGFREEMLEVVSQCPPDRQILLLSATLPGSIRKLGEKLMDQPELVLINYRLKDHSKIHQSILLADDTDHKEKLLRWLLENETFNKALVFTNTRNQANRLDGLLRYFEQKSAQIHGDVHQKGRQATIEAFHEGSINVLVATDVAARGLDVKGVDLIINFEVPRKGDDYLHRIGRSGRGDETGASITFVTPPEWNLMSSIERYLKTRFSRMVVKELAGTFKGPKKLKASGKAASKKKKKKKSGKK